MARPQRDRVLEPGKDRGARSSPLARDVRRLVREVAVGLGPRQVQALERGVEDLLRSAVEEIGRKRGVEYLEQALRVLRETMGARFDLRAELLLVIGTGRTLDVLGEWDAALTHYSRAAELARETGEERMRAEALRWQGHLHRKRGEWGEALRANRESLGICRAIGHRAGEAYALNNLATVHFERGEWEEVETYYRDALEAGAELGEERLVAQIHATLGALANTRGEWVEAVAHYHKSLPAYERAGDDQGLAQTYYNLGLTLADQEDWVSAGEYFEKSLEVARQIGDANLQGLIFVQRARIFLRLRDHGIAASYGEMALRMLEGVCDQLGVAEARTFLGAIEGARGKAREAERHFAEALKITQGLASPLGEAEACHEYARFLLLRRDREKARTYFARTRDLYRGLGARREVERIEVEMGALGGGGAGVARASGEDPAR